MYNKYRRCSLLPPAGHYMYVDSVYAKTFKEVAKLSSPMTTVPMSGCLSFLYQRGEERGNLFSVYTRDQSGQYQDLWRADADQTSAGTWEWIPVQVDLKAPYALQVSGVRLAGRPTASGVSLSG